ncbi:MAG: hypothetical protein NT027_17405 [Proteobacteria bacterium]|nr:hypothetical protein [Pseudomonadota bacterium]
MKKARIFGILWSIACASSAFAHPPGVYRLDGNDLATVTFKMIGRCPVENPNSLKGVKRSLTFSDDAIAAPYNFTSGVYVEIHEGTQEVYVQVSDTCVPVQDGSKVLASHDTFNGFSIEKID